jgi:hypothetical protein
MDFIKTLLSQLNPKTIEDVYAFDKFGGFIKNRFEACVVQPAELAAGCIGAVQQATSPLYIIFKYLHAAVQLFACYPK